MWKDAFERSNKINFQTAQTDLLDCLGIGEELLAGKQIGVDLEGRSKCEKIPQALLRLKSNCCVLNKMYLHFG